MTRSTWKGPFISYKIKKKLTTTMKTNIPTKIWSRSSTIIPQFIGKQVLVHNGRTFQQIKITNEMTGHKFGEFVQTKKKAIHKKMKKTK